MVFKLSKDLIEEQIEIDLKIYSSGTQLGLALGGTFDGTHKALIVVYESGNIHLNGKLIGNWRKL